MLAPHINRSSSAELIKVRRRVAYFISLQQHPENAMRRSFLESDMRKHIKYGMQTNGQEKGI